LRNLNYELMNEDIFKKKNLNNYEKSKYLFDLFKIYFNKIMNMVQTSQLLEFINENEDFDCAAICFIRIGGYLVKKIGILDNIL
jgi:hypothetical protein